MKCKICCALTDHLREKKSDAVYFFCQQCGFVFLSPDFYLSPTEEKARYELHENTIENAGYVQMFESFIESAVIPWIREEAAILDYGCGPGPVLAELLRKRKYSVDVYDPYFFPAMEYTGKKYDLITATEVIEHLSDPLCCILQLKKILNPNGKIAIMTQFNTHEPDSFLKWYYRREDTHISFFNTQVFSALAAALDLHIIYCDDTKTIVFEI